MSSGKVALVAVASSFATVVVTLFTLGFALAATDGGTDERVESTPTLVTPLDIRDGPTEFDMRNTDDAPGSDTTPFEQRNRTTNDVPDVRDVPQRHQEPLDLTGPDYQGPGERWEEYWEEQQRREENCDRVDENGIPSAASCF